MVLESIAPLPLKRETMKQSTIHCVKWTTVLILSSKSPPTPPPDTETPLSSSQSNPIPHLSTLTILRRIYPPPRLSFKPFVATFTAIRTPFNHLNCLVFACGLVTSLLDGSHLIILPLPASSLITQSQCLAARLVLGLHLVNLLSEGCPWNSCEKVIWPIDLSRYAIL